MFGAIKNIGKKIQSIDLIKLVEQSINMPIVQAQIVDLNEAQMDKGIDAKGMFIGNYSNTSVTKYGKTPGPITLKDTGETRGSMKVVNGNESFVITANTDLHGKDLTYLFTPSLGLTPESMAEVMPDIIADVQTKFREQVFR